MSSKNFKGWDKKAVEQLTSKIKIVGEVEPKLVRLNVKPLSQNDAWSGRRFKSDAYKGFTKEVGYKLNKIKIEIPEGKLQINYKFGFSSNGSDVGNPEKSITDLLGAKYDFNDNRIWRIIIEKEIVKKGFEFIEFEIIKYEHTIHN